MKVPRIVLRKIRSICDNTELRYSDYASRIGRHVIALLRRSAYLLFRILVSRKLFCCTNAAYRQYLKTFSRIKFSQFSWIIDADIILSHSVGFTPRSDSLDMPCKKCFSILSPIVYLDGRYLKDFLMDLYEIAERITEGVLLIPFVEPSIDPEIIQWDKLKNFKAIYIQNFSFDTPNCYPLPIGIKDSWLLSFQNFPFTTKAIRAQKLKKRKINLLVSFSAWTNPIRMESLRYLSSQDWPTVLGGEGSLKPSKRYRAHLGNLPMKQYFKNLSFAKYTFCPPGVGFDTHRFYESLYLGSIPVVLQTNTPFDKLFSVFPCLVVKNIEEISPERLENSYKILIPQVLEVSKKLRDKGVCVNDLSKFFA